MFKVHSDLEKRKQSSPSAAHYCGSVERRLSRLERLLPNTRVCRENEAVVRTLYTRRLEEENARLRAGLEAAWSALDAVRAKELSR